MAIKFCIPMKTKVAENAPSSEELEDFEEKSIAQPMNNEANTTALFKDLNLNEILLSGIREAQFENPSPVQALAIPKVLLGSDILCQAKSGTGKTAVFVLGLLQLLLDNPTNSYIVIAHTKELVEQIEDEFNRFSRDLDVNIRNADGPGAESFNILIGTAERVNSLIKTIDFDQITGIVVDECDAVIGDERMTKAFENIIKRVPINIHLMMFSATLSKITKKKCLSYLRDPFLVLVDDDSKLTLRGLKQYFVESRESEKLERLVAITGASYKQNGVSNSSVDNSDGMKYQQVIVFCKDSQNALYIEHTLDKARAITSYMDIRERIKILNDFKNRKFLLLSTTDMLSRGIDIQNVDCVVNYNLPGDPQTYLHRVGRAGRFETSGTAFSFVNGIMDGVRLNEIMDLYEIDIEKYTN